MAGLIQYHRMPSINPLVMAPISGCGQFPQQLEQSGCRIRQIAAERADEMQVVVKTQS
jgi:hypothetical protein